MRKIRPWNFTLVLMVPVLWSGCTSASSTTVELMPAPDVFAATGLDPLEGLDYEELSESVEGVLYATNRAPEYDEDGELTYKLGRDIVLRGGLADVRFAKEQFDWDELRKLTTSSDRKKKYKLRIDHVSEYGVLKNSIPPFYGSEETDNLVAGGEAFIGKVNKHLARSDYKDINIYVHGYNVDFENPILVAAQLWHYMGYDGAFVTFNWPSTPKALAYIKDVATAGTSARYLRMLVQLLHEQSSAENINIIAYSAGNRVAVAALNELALIYREKVDPDNPSTKPLGAVLLISGDIDRKDFSNALFDNALDISRSITVYNSRKDKVLGYSRWLFGKRDRLGDALDPDSLTEREKDVLRKATNLYIVDVSDAEQISVGGGHSYFRSSPWVSSDLLMDLRFHLSPGERGLEEIGDSPIWRFPADYPERLKELVAEGDIGVRVAQSSETVEGSSEEQSGSE